MTNVGALRRERARIRAAWDVETGMTWNAYRQTVGRLTVSAIFEATPF
jgi:hypothetical protein